MWVKKINVEEGYKSVYEENVCGRRRWAWIKDMIMDEMSVRIFISKVGKKNWVRKLVLFKFGLLN